MKITKIKNKKIQQFLEKNELQRLIISMLINKKVFKKDLFYNKYFKTNKRTFCLLTCRSKAVYRNYLLSRIKIRELCFEGVINGLKKISW